MRLSWKSFFAIAFIFVRNAGSQEDHVWRNAENGMVYSTGCYYSDFDYHIIPSNTSDCSQKCYDDEKCTHFSWNHGTCFMKKNVNVGTKPAKGDRSSRCGFRGPRKNLDWHSFASDKLRYARGCYFEYNNMKSVIEKTPNDCFLQCLGNSRCSHFSWNWEANGTCWLKHNFSPESEPLMRHQEEICGFKTRRLFEFDVNHNLISSSCDFEGNILINEITKTAHACSRLCMKNTACTHFSYTDKDGGRCFLKNDVSDRNRPIFTRNLIQCGFKYVPPDPTRMSCHIFKGRGDNFCNVNVGLVLNKKKLL